MTANDTSLAVATSSDSDFTLTIKDAFAPKPAFNDWGRNHDRASNDGILLYRCRLDLEKIAFRLVSIVDAYREDYRTLRGCEMDQKRLDV